MVWEEDKLHPRYMGPFEIVQHIEKVSYKLALGPDLSLVHDVFHVFMLKKYVSDLSYILSQEPIKVYEDLTYEEKPVKILDREDNILSSRSGDFLVNTVTLSCNRFKTSNHEKF